MEAPAKHKDLTFSDHGIPGLVIHPDGTVTRSPHVFPDLPPSPCPQPDEGQIASKDVILDYSSSNSLSARIFLPNINSPGHGKLPVAVFFHGGAFLILTAATALYHQFCERLAKDANVIIVSVNYSLAPEYKLPKAYDDAVAAIKWLQSQSLASFHEGNSDPWLALHADYSSIFIIGDSAGGNIAYNLSLRLAHEDIKPLSVKGLILIQPAFGGSLQGADDRNIYIGNRNLWRLALPSGAGEDHIFCNPTIDPPSILENIALPRAMVLLGGLDRMHEKQHEFATWLKKANKDVELTVFQNAAHGFYLFPLEDTAQLFEKVSKFIRSYALL